MPALCVVTAIEIEFKTVSQALAERTFSSPGRFACCRGRAGANQVTVFRSEMGAEEFAPWLAGHLAEYPYDALLVLGLAGGLRPRLKPGDTVIYDRCLKPANFKENPFRREEIASIACDSRLVLNLVQTFKQQGIQGIVGPGITVDEVIADPLEKQRLGDRSDALAVDMESFALLRVARQAGIPAGAVRVISDDATMELPDFSRAMTPAGRIRPWAMARITGERPLVMARFLRTVRPALSAFKVAARAALATEIAKMV